ncbi:MAG: CehA/McbA family metallohydrolase [Planctomycetales bacterium]|nr:CehA/McbA family metallohydrolase [Planctomycetales bacterium]
MKVRHIAVGLIALLLAACPWGRWSSGHSFGSSVAAQEIALVEDIEGQPLGANVTRLIEALRFLGAPLSDEDEARLREAAEAKDARAIQDAMDPLVSVEVSLNPEVRVKARRGPGPSVLRQGGFTPLIVKVINEPRVSAKLNVTSPQAGPVYDGAAMIILARQAQTELLDGAGGANASDRFLGVEMFGGPPMTERLSGAPAEYALLLVYSAESGQREATLAFDVGNGTQDIGFRGETPILFDVRPAVPVELSILDEQGAPTTARLLIRDAAGHVYPPQAKRLAPDFFFQPHIYRTDGETLLLPPGEFEVQATRGPEYVTQTQTLVVDATGESSLEVRLERWIDPARFGYYSGDHHIHGAGCSHYESPTQGVRPQDMFAQVKGEGLNVGCVLTWGPCFDFQRQYFSPQADALSEPMTLLKYDLEISGFGSAAMGHVCLLNLSNQVYPGSEGTKEQGWPTWTVPVMRWAKEQGGYTGYPHSAMNATPARATERLFALHDRNQSATLDIDECASALLPASFAAIDADQDRALTPQEVAAAFDRAVDELPNLVVPDMDGSGAMEIFVSVPEGVCDFTSAMNTPRIGEWNTWYHLLNCGYPLKLSGETDFPCMSGRRVGQGRVYVQLGELESLDFPSWCRGLAEGRSYISDGYAHAIDFRVNQTAAGTEGVELSAAGTVRVSARVAFSPEVPMEVAYGQRIPEAGRRVVGDTVNLHADRTDELVRGGTRLVEVVAGGKVVGSVEIPADGQLHDVTFDVPIERSTWVALRQFPQLHTNPVDVIVDEQPIRVSRASARWCEESVEQLWRDRNLFIAPHERDAARAAYDRASEDYRKRAAEAPEGS